MGTLTYSMITSLDGYIEDDKGNFDWAEPGPDLHRYFNDLESKTELMMYGRNMYRIMSYWEHIYNLEQQPDYIRDYARIWKSKQKIVFSTSMDAVATSGTVLKKEFLAPEIIAIKEKTQGIISIGGAGIASSAIGMGLVDEIHAFVFPVLLGSGKKWISGVPLTKLRFLGMEALYGGVVMMRYRVLATHPLNT